MPIFEFVCTNCKNPFEELVFSANAVDDITCPACGSEEVNKKISTFASRVSGGSSFSMGSSQAASCSTGSL
jgi:putative FmdB family regulatory protein